MHALGDRVFLENNAFEAVRGRSDLNGLQKIREVLAFDRADRRNIMVALDALTRMPVLCAAVFLSGDKAVVVLSVLLVILSVLGAFETSTVQACIPQMLAGDNIIKGNAVVNQVASVSYLIAPLLGGILYSAVGLKPVMYAIVRSVLGLKGDYLIKAKAVY